MKEKRYKTQWVPYVVIFSFLMIPFVFRFGIESLILIAWFIFGGLVLAFGTYTLITPDQKLKNVNFLYHRRTFSICDITEIRKIPLYFNLGWGFGYRLLIYFTNEIGEKDKTEINLNHYKKEDIADLLRTLLEINPNIKLDKETEKLMKK